jgi:hypothetical protein
VNEFPCLEVIALPWTVQVGAGWAVGTRYRLSANFEIGKKHDADLQARFSSIARRHTRIEFRHGRWWAFDLGSSNGTYVNGARINDVELCHCDVLELPWGLTFRVLLRDPSAETNVAIEQEVFEFPDDDQRWDVWADWLLERGAPLGRRLREVASAVDDDARSLGSMAVLYRAGVIEPQFRRGFPVRVVLRNPGVPWLPMGDVRHLVERLLAEPAFRFVRHLEVDVISFTPPAHQGDATHQLEGVLEALAATSNPRWLETVRLGPVAQAGLHEGQRAVLEAVRARHPNLVTIADRLLFVARNASLEVVAAPPDFDMSPRPGESVGLTTDAPNVIGQVDDAAVRIEGPAVLQLVFQEGRWIVDDLRRDQRATLRVNGRDAGRAVLRDGDTIELLGGPCLRFRMR